MHKQAIQSDIEKLESLSSEEMNEVVGGAFWPEWLFGTEIVVGPDGHTSNNTDGVIDWVCDGINSVLGTNL